LGVVSWSSTHYKARDVINRDIEAGWYRKASEREGVDYNLTPFSSSRMLNWRNQLKDLSVYKVLELSYEYLAKDIKEDAFLYLSDKYSKKYESELKRVIRAGIDYDWNFDDSIDSDEKSYQRLTRRLQRV
jgi:hypothetical protein